MDACGYHTDTAPFPQGYPFGVFYGYYMNTMRKKILYVITKSNFGGAQRYVYELATRLPKDAYEVAVAFGGEGILKTKLEEAGIRTRTIQSFERDISLSKELRAYGELSSIIKEERPDIVHLNSSKAGGTGALAARVDGVPRIIYTAHGWPFYEKRNVLARLIIWTASWVTTLLSHAVIVVSKHDQDHARMTGLSRKLSHIPTALPEISFKDRDTARKALFPAEVIEAHQNDIWIVSTGEHTKNKNLGMLIEAIAKLPEKSRSNVFLTLMGEGEDRPHLETLIQKHNLEAQVFFTGFVDDARTFLPAFDIFVLPSLKEGFPYGLLEAGAAGVPIIASNVGGIPELVVHNETGLLVDPHDTHSLTDALQTILNDTDAAQVRAVKLKEKVSAEYDIEKMMAKTLAVYNT